MPLTARVDSIVALRFRAWLYAAGAVALGLVIVFGGRARFSGAAYKQALGVPGAPASWGIVILLSAALLLYGMLARRFIIAAAGIFSCAAWSCFFALSFIASSGEPRAGLTGGPVYLLWVAAPMLVDVNVIVRSWRRGTLIGYEGRVPANEVPAR